MVLDIRLLYETDAQKRRRADFIVPTGLGRRESLRHLRRIVTLMRCESLSRHSASRHARDRS